MKRIDFAALMYRHVPEVWRERDNFSDIDGTRVPGDLERLLTEYGAALDALYRTIRQRYYDQFPDFDDRPPDADGLERGCQPWVLSYIARLLDVTPRSPLDSGRRAEVEHAIAWRQRKGTLDVAERVAEHVGGFEAELQEGWRILAVTPRPGLALLPETSFGETAPVIEGTGSGWLGPVRARHPGLPNGTVDLRWCSRAVRASLDDPTTQVTRFQDIAMPPGTPPAEIAAARKRVRKDGERWRQANRHGAPCFPGSFQDVSARTVDLRNPDWRRGHAHPRRVCLHVPPFEGLCALDAIDATWSPIADAIADATALADSVPLLLESADGLVTLRPKLAARRVVLRGKIVHPGGDDAWRFVDLDLDEAPTGANIECVNCRVRDASAPFPIDAPDAQWTEVGPALQRLDALPAGFPVRIVLDGGTLLLRRNKDDEPVRIVDAATLASTWKWRIEDLWFDDIVQHGAGSLQVLGSAVRTLVSTVSGADAPRVDVQSSLLGEFKAHAARLEYCTILGPCIAPKLFASDCIFLSMPGKDVPPPAQLPDEGCLRWSRLPAFPEDDGSVHISIARSTCTTAMPIFVSDTFGESGCGVLHPATAGAVLHGAEDAGELGAFHDARHVLRAQAVLDKLSDFLPLGVTPVLAPDASMRCAPPAAT